MTIETKYNIGNYVYFLGNGCIARSFITSIETLTTDKSSPSIVKYHLAEAPTAMSEFLLFESKEDLIKSL